jgi:uncharacterized damage-inducible protein DinB
MRTSLPLVLLALAPAVPGPARAQDAAMKSIAPFQETVKEYLIASAEQMPEELYSYRPTDEVRTFGQIIGHVANTQYRYCGAAMGEGGQAPENFEERTTKAGLVEALKMGFEACDAAYAMDDAKAVEEVQFGRTTRTRLWVLSSNLTHNWEHYGNLVVYFRANGMVPPSSQGGGM